MQALKAGIIVLLILVSFIAVGMLIKSVGSNPWIGQPVPPSMRTPNKDPPTIEIQSPENTTYYKNEVLLNFTVTKPQSWVTTNVSCFITGVVYEIDAKEVVLFNWSDPTGNHTLPSPGLFSVPLQDLAEGQHALRINISAFSRFWTTPEFNFFYEDYPLNVSETIGFTVEGEPSPSPTLPEFTSTAFLILFVVTVLFAIGLRRQRIVKNGLFSQVRLRIICSLTPPT